MTPCSLLPERHRLVIVGYFLEGRTSQELARFLGVTESRVSQLRSEALAMLKEGIEAQYAGQAGPSEQRIGRVARRKAGYASGHRRGQPLARTASARSHPPSSDPVV